MAAYPSYAQLTESTRIPESGTIVERSVSGKARIRDYYTSTRYSFVVGHELSGADKDALIAHYESEKRNAFSFTWKGTNQSYNVRYAGPPVETPMPGSDIWRVTCRLVVV